jgi:hypothetical protein
VVPEGHAFSLNKPKVGWAVLEREPLVILARREGVGLHDAVLSGCRAGGV